MAPDVIEFKKAFFKTHGSVATCAVNGTKITFQDSHVDHIEPDTFERIVCNFVESRGLHVNESLLSSGSDGEIGRVLSSRTMTEDWIEFHRKNARLRVISAKANLSDVKLKV